MVSLTNVNRSLFFKSYLNEWSGHQRDAILWSVPRRYESGVILHKVTSILFCPGASTWNQWRRDGWKAIIVPCYIPICHLAQGRVRFFKRREYFFFLYAMGTSSVEYTYTRISEALELLAIFPCEILHRICWYPSRVVFPGLLSALVPRPLRRWRLELHNTDVFPF